MPLERWQWLLQLNVTSVFQICQAVLPLMRAQERNGQLSGGGLIINVSSHAARNADSLSDRPHEDRRHHRPRLRFPREAARQVLEVLLDKIATYLEKSEALKTKVKKALTYPAIVLVFAFVVTAILLIFVIPVFDDLFKGFGAELPALTPTVIQISQVFQEYWFLILGLPVVAVVGFLEGRKRSRKFYQLVDRWVLQIPLIGDLVATSANARFARTLSTLFSGGVPLVDAMRAAIDAEDPGAMVAP
jgi:hypothetical protein